MNAAIEAEAQALAKLDHPNIVQVFEPGEHAGWAFFAMQYIEGGDAHKFGRRVPPPSWRQIVDVYRRVARALAFAHKEGLLHGDIKPSNILINKDGFPFLADFGLARIVVRNAPESERDGLRHQAGTLVYMAPEVLSGGLGDERSDQFSLCVALLHTLTGTAPFCGDTSGEVLADIEECLEETLELLETAALREVLRKGLAMDPVDRFASVDELADALDRLVGVVPSMASPEFEPEPSSDGAESATPVSDATSASVSEPESPDQPEPGEERPDENERGEPAELMPLAELDGEEVVLRVGAAPLPSKRRLGSYVAAALLGMGCVAVGWVGGRGQIEVVDPPNDPVPLPTTPCASGDEQGVSVEIDPVVLAVCTYIRRGELDDADTTWLAVYLSRWAEIESLTAAATLNPAAPATLDPAEAAEKLGADTMIIVQTFQEWAKLSVGPDVAKANDFVRFWTPLAEKAWAEARKIREKRSGRAEAEQPAPK